MAATSEGPSQLFVGSLPVTLLQPNKNGPDSLFSQEYRIEISRPDDFEFLYAEGITRTKYQTLAKTWNLNVDFDDFPARIVRLLRERVGATSPQPSTILNFRFCSSPKLAVVQSQCSKRPLLTVVWYFQLERDERDSALSTIEHLKDELADAEKKVRELEEDLDQCEEECEELEGKVCSVF
ncbi:unnamed protein product [Haemonchus placei]|uniref:SAS-6_N domain-containing protein n=1 Tax=Haemonchus placei TaxID=6290 RepID=A0A0N4W612_HAEPC|nr:unnamed protein product [Haemonchus placei]